jgi:hypothetical protein
MIAPRWPFTMYTRKHTGNAKARNMNPEKAEGLSPELHTEPLPAVLQSLSEQIREYDERIEASVRRETVEAANFQ